MSALAPTLQAFFTDRLIRQRHASPHTIAAYRDTLRLLLALRRATAPARQPSQLDIADLDAPLIGAFLDHLEHERGNSVRTRNARLAAIHSLFRYAALRHPEHAATHRSGCWRSRPNAPTARSSPSSPSPRSTRCSPPPTAPPGPAGATTPCCCSPIQTGLRVSELIGLTCADVHLGAGAHVSCHGKGRKERITPLTSEHRRGPARLARANAHGQPDRPAVPDPHAARRSAATRSNTASPNTPPPPHTAARRCTTRRSPPHVLRHTAAMRLLHAGVDTTVIALWLGHEQRRHHPDLPARRPRPQRTSARPHHATRRHSPAATAHPTRSSPSSKRSDYADLTTPITARRHSDSRPDVGIIRTSA